MFSIASLKFVARSIGNHIRIMVQTKKKRRGLKRNASKPEDISDLQSELIEKVESKYAELLKDNGHILDFLLYALHVPKQRYAYGFS